MQIINYSLKNGLEKIKNKNKNIIINMDTSLVSTHKIKLPNLSISQAKKSIPFNLSNKLLDNIDDLEFFINKNNDYFSVLVITKKILNDLKNIIKKQNLKVIGVSPDFMLMPFTNDKINYIENNANIIFRTEKYDGGQLNKDLFFAKFSKGNTQKVKFQFNDYNLINLLKIDILSEITNFIKSWNYPIIIALFIFIASISITITENNKMQRTLKNLNQSNQKTFKKMFPEVKKIVDIKVQTKQKLKGLDKQVKLQDNDFLSALLKKNIKKSTIESIVFDKTIITK